MADTCLGERTIYRELGYLEQRGYLQVMKRTLGRKAKVTYILNPAARAAKGAAEAVFPRGRASTPPLPTHSPLVKNGHPWLKDLYELDLAVADPLNDQHPVKIEARYGDRLDISEEVERFVAFFRVPSNRERTHANKSWTTYSRLTNWLRKAKADHEKNNPDRHLADVVDWEAEKAKYG